MKLDKIGYTILCMFAGVGVLYIFQLLSVVDHLAPVEEQVTLGAHHGKM